METLPLKVLKEMEVGAVVQVIDKIEVTSKHGGLYNLVKTLVNNDGEQDG